MQRAFILILLLFFPVSVHATEIDAGFPKQSLWVSKTSAIAGETIEIFTVVHNGSAPTLSGTVVFTADGKRLGTKNFELPSGISELISMDWKVNSGIHTISAAIEGASQKGVRDGLSLSSSSSAAVTVTGTDPAPTPTITNAASQVSEVLSEAVDNATPAVKDIIAVSYEKAEAFREQSIAKLESYLGTPKNGSVLGASTTNISTFTTPQKSDNSIVSKLGQTAAAGALFILKAKQLFYPLLLLSIILALYLLFRWALRKRY